MPKFRKKPVIIEAIQWNGPDTNTKEVEKFVGQELSFKEAPAPQNYYLMIPTLESPHEASTGDWIIKGVSGEFYPCKPEIFEKTYEPVGE